MLRSAKALRETVKRRSAHRRKEDLGSGTTVREHGAEVRGQKRELAKRTPPDVLAAIGPGVEKSVASEMNDE